MTQSARQTARRSRRAKHAKHRAASLSSQEKRGAARRGGRPEELRLRRIYAFGGGRGSACALGVVPEGGSDGASGHRGKVSWDLVEVGKTRTAEQAMHLRM